MKKGITLALIVLCCVSGFGFDSGCYDSSPNKTAKQEQAHTEQNQTHLNQVQPPPVVSWSLERDNLIKRFKLQNDRSVNFYMYVFVEGVQQPVGFYQINKASSVNSQLTNTAQLVQDCSAQVQGCLEGVLPSPAEDGSYGTNGDAVFGFTPEEIYIETNMHYIVSTVPLTFREPVNRLAIINSDEAKQMLEKSKAAMNK